MYQHVHQEQCPMQQTKNMLQTFASVTNPKNLSQCDIQYVGLFVINVNINFFYFVSTAEKNFSSVSTTVFKKQF